MGYKQKTPKRKEKCFVKLHKPLRLLSEARPPANHPKGQYSAKGPELCDSSACPDY
jgi:hypothetical protein